MTMAKTETKTKSPHWAEALAAELVAERRARQERREWEAGQAGAERRALEEKIQSWWPALVAECETVAEALHPVLFLVVDAEVIGRLEVRAGAQGRAVVVLEDDGHLRVERRGRDVGDTTYLRLAGAEGGGIEPTPVAAAREILEPWLRRIGREL